MISAALLCRRCMYSRTLTDAEQGSLMPYEKKCDDDEDEMRPRERDAENPAQDLGEKFKKSRVWSRFRFGTGNPCSFPAIISSPCLFLLWIGS
jgi:hypothetical protein